MSSVRARPRWFFLITPRWLGWHAFAVVATIGMLWLGDWQFHRAESGNALSWAYTFEWPIFAIFGVVFWAKTIRDEFKPHSDPGEVPDVDLPAGAGAGVGASAVTSAGTLAVRERDGRLAGEDDADADDPELAAYNAYLARLNDQVKGHGRWHGLR
jgi:hypothetical protein